MYGTQTQIMPLWQGTKFENDVKMYGTQTQSNLLQFLHLFENDVKMYGTQTIFSPQVRLLRLRMM